MEQTKGPFEAHLDEEALIGSLPEVDGPDAVVPFEAPKQGPLLGVEVEKPGMFLRDAPIRPQGVKLPK